jgi:hypothetical protein
VEGMGEWRGSRFVEGHERAVEPDLQRAHRALLERQS